VEYLHFLIKTFLAVRCHCLLLVRSVTYNLSNSDKFEFIIKLKSRYKENEITQEANSFSVITVTTVDNDNKVNDL